MKFPQLFSKTGSSRSNEAPIKIGNRQPATGNQSEPSHVGCYRRNGFLQVDMVFALALFAIAIMPLGYSFARERQVLKIEYYHSAINELVDGEMEILVAGAAKNLPEGTQNYSVTARAAAKLPSGHFELTKNANHLRLAWLPDEKRGVGVIAREANFK